jgi:hypothetical protein
LRTTSKPAAQQNEKEAWQVAKETYERCRVLPGALPKNRHYVK